MLAMPPAAAAPTPAPAPAPASTGPSLDDLLMGLGSSPSAAPGALPDDSPAAGVELGIGFDLPLPTPRASPPVAVPPAAAGPAVAPAGGGSAEAALAKGLGIPLPPDMAAADWERLGATVRQLVEGLSQLLSARAALKRELRAHNKTEMPMRDVNPFKSELGLKDVLQQLLFNANRNGKFMPVERAVREAAEDLLTHDLAIIAASRASVQGTVEEFDPQRLTQQFGKKGLIDMVAHANLWRQYEANYKQQSTHMADWLERLFEDHFVTAYCNEADRLSQQHVPLP
jgi:FHA domain-containing protein